MNDTVKLEIDDIKLEVNLEEPQVVDVGSVDVRINGKSIVVNHIADIILSKLCGNGLVSDNDKLNVAGDQVKFVYDEDEEMLVMKKTFTITPTVTNGSFVGGYSITDGEEAVVRIVPNPNKNLPNTITVTGCDYSYSKDTGIVVLSSPTTNVVIIATCG